MNVFKIVGNTLLRLHLDNIWRPVNYSDTDWLIKKIREYKYDEEHKLTEEYLKRHEENLRKYKSYYP